MAFTPPQVAIVEIEGRPDRWALTQELTYRRAARGGRPAADYTVTLPFHTDLASVPSAFAWAIPRYGAHTKAAIVHDGLCVSEMDRFLADEIFRDALADSQVTGGRRWLLWTGVTWGSVHAALRAVVKGGRAEPVPPVRTSDLPPREPGAVAGAAGAHAPAAVLPARLRALAAALVVMAACLSLLHGTVVPGDWLDVPDRSGAWTWVLVVSALAALILAGALITTAVALRRLELLRGTFPRAWLISVGVLPFVPVAAAAAVLMFAYTLGAPLRRWVTRMRADEDRRGPGYQRLEQARANFMA